MNIKIQGGGGGTYANTGSAFGAMTYLNHENEARREQGKPIEPFFSHEKENKDFDTMVSDLDQNKAKLMQKDAKFFALSISPSKEELKHMGRTEEERANNMAKYTRSVMDEYAKNFNKGLEGKDLMYYAKIHHGRGKGKEEENMHAHVIVSRKDKNNKIRLSPQTNHRKKNGKINGFDRSNFYQECEKSFDKKFEYNRNYDQTFEYNNALKNGTFEEKKQAIDKGIGDERNGVNKENQRQNENVRDRWLDDDRAKAEFFELNKQDQETKKEKDQDKRPGLEMEI